MSLSNLKDHIIVYSAASKDADIEHEAAYTLRQTIAARTGDELPVFVEKKENAPTILLGKVTGLAPAIDEYILQKTEDGFALAAGSCAAYDDLLRAFLEAIEGEREIPTSALPQKTADRSIGRRHGDLRVIYHNIFGYDRKPTINPQRRYAFEARLYREYDADILCLQEYDSGSRKNLAPLLEQRGFEEVPVDQLGFPKNCSPILFDKTRVTPLDHGFYPFAYKSEVNELVCNNHDTKNATWAVFEKNDTRKRFVVISMHYYYSPDASTDMTNRVESNKARIENAKEIYALIENTIRTKNGGAWKDLPILLGGDLNCGYSNRTLPSLVADCGGRIALDVMEELGMKPLQKNSTVFADGTGSYCWYPTYNEELGYYDSCGDPSSKTFDQSIDHVFTFGEGLCGKTFDILDGSFAKKTSDHCPILVDLDLE